MAKVRVDRARATDPELALRRRGCGVAVALTLAFLVTITIAIAIAISIAIGVILTTILATDVLTVCHHATTVTISAGGGQDLRGARLE